MKISDHADRTQELFNLRAEDIHKWIDGFFDRDSFEQFLSYGKTKGYNPYDHRAYRHCREALADALKEFSHKYSPDQIRNVFEAHIRDDYDGYIPSREDFANGTFSEKYHESEITEERILSPGELNHYFKGLYYRRKREREGRGVGFLVRIVVPVVLSLVLFILSIYLVILPLFHDSLMAEKKEMIRELSAVAVSVVDYYISLEEEGIYSRQEAQKAAVDEIRNLHYGPNGDLYFWITDHTPVMIMHPWRSDLEGRNLTDFTDSLNRSGKKLFVESVDLVEAEGGGFLEYLWQFSEESRRVVPKLSFVQGIESWGWIIGTGFFVHDVEDEISRLTYQLSLIFFGISLFMILVLLYILFQSHTIERNRRQAEAGLVEAKERYRALVEASNEGYMLRVQGSIVFFNPVIQRMTGYSDDELLSAEILNQLFPPDTDYGQNQAHIANLKSADPQTDEFEAAIHCHSGSRLDVIIRISRIFLSEQNGDIISFRLIGNSAMRVPFILDHSIPDDPHLFTRQLEHAQSSPEVVRALNQLPQLVRSLLNHETGAVDLRRVLSEAYHSAVERFVEFFLEESGPAPVEFAFLSLGSSGRREMTLFSDQDNALVFASSAEGEELEKDRLFFLRLASSVCTNLNQSGFSWCPGGIMAMNPAWCLSLAEWQAQYSKWINQADQISLLDIHVFFDISSAWGLESLTREMQAQIFRSSRNNPEFLGHFARNCLQYRPPLGLLGGIRTEERQGESVVNIKESLIPLINFVRLYALKYELASSSTLERIDDLYELEILNSSSRKEIVEAFEFLWKLRFSNQLLSHSELRRVNDDLDPATLSDENRKELRRVLAVISGLQSRLSYDFLGVDLSNS